MDAYQSAQPVHNRTSHLTRLYSDVKKSAGTNLVISQPVAELSPVLQRKYRIQRDRLITWGLAWSDDEKGGDGNIDDSVARAGLTETVDSVLRNIKEVTEEAERIRLGTLLPSGADKMPLQSTTTDGARYEDLLNDLTTSIDILYDLSMSRRALARGEHPSFGPDSAHFGVSGFGEKGWGEKGFGEKGSSSKAGLHRPASPAASELTLVNPPAFTRPSLSPYAGLPSRIDLSALRLTEESPPPYDSSGVPSTTRLVGRLIRGRVSESIQSATGSSAPEVPVLVEYANFDSIYRDTHVPPPLQRLEALTNYLAPMRSESQTNISLLGYFEDPSQPRLGLVYDIPYVVQNRLQVAAPGARQSLSPVSLLKSLQKSRKPATPNDDNATPALESRFQLALRLTEQLRELHNRELYHGNINSSSVLFTMVAGESPLQHNHMCTALWTSFDLFSKCSVEGITLDDSFNIYRHPADVPKDAKRNLVTDIRYDLYGLALVLLEIGLWLPIGELYKPKYTIADFKLRIERLWIPKLAAKCGSAYMRAIQACLRVADEPNTTDVDIAALYGHLLERLRRCCLLDEDGVAAELAPPTAFAGYPYVDSTMSQPAAKTLSTIAPSVSAASTWPAEDARTTSSSALQGLGSARLERKRRRMERKTELREKRLAHAGRKDRQGKDVPTRLQDDSHSARHYSDEPSISVNQRRPMNIDEGPRRGVRAVQSFQVYKSQVVLLQRWWRAYLKNQADLMAMHKRAHQSSKSEGPKRREFPNIELPPALLEDWHNRLAFQMADLVEKALKGSPESSSIAMTAYGETPESARPTLIVCCKSTAKVKHAIKRHFRYDQSRFDVRVKKDEIRRCRGGIHRSMARDVDMEKAANPDYQPKPLCGASIGAFRDEEHLPPVSFGGVILVDGRPFGMSVHHMLEQDEDDDHSGEFDDEDDDSDDDDDDTSSIGSFDMDDSAMSEDEETVRPPSTIADDSLPTNSYEGDVVGISPKDFEEILVTQPALDDAIELDLHVDEDEDEDEDSGIDEDHLLSYKLGQIHASSGLKRSARPHSMAEGFRTIGQSLPQEIDWALFELLPPRAHPYNVVRGGSRFTSVNNRRNEDSFPVAIRSSTSLACVKVHCLGRTSGLQSGVISSAMELVKIHGRSTFSASWTVDGDFGVGGDSGAWVIGNDDGRVCGHVLACRRGKTYICPMDLLFQDIKTTLGAQSVSLPQTSSAIRPSTGRALSQRSIQKAMGRLRMSEPESGGVTLPASPPDSPPLRPLDRERSGTAVSGRIRMAG